MFTIKKHVWLTALLLGTVAAVTLIAPAQATHGIDKDVDVALEKLYESAILPRHSGQKLKESWCSLLLGVPYYFKSLFRVWCPLWQGDTSGKWENDWMSKAIGSASCA